jgi:hypothetical protein
MDIGGGDGGGNGGGRGGAVALALLGLHRGQAADALAHAACLQPRVAGGGGSGARFAWIALGSGY